MVDNMELTQKKCMPCEGKVKIITYTHVVNGLTENDFILTAKIDKI